MSANLESKDYAYHIRELLGRGMYEDAKKILAAGLLHFPVDPHLVQIAEEIPHKLYSSEFFDGQRLITSSSASIILSILFEYFSPTSAIDIGAGSGVWSQSLLDLGVNEVTAVDGPWATHLSMMQGINFVPANFNDEFPKTGAHNLAICVEVAEHFKPSRSEKFIEYIANSSDVVLFAAALPRQLGEGHINCRNHSFWARIFETHSYVPLDIFRSRVWCNSSVLPWYRQNCFLYVKKNLVGFFRGAPLASHMDVYHPLLVNQLVLLDHNK